jgi:hypothetical protein
MPIFQTKEVKNILVASCSSRGLVVELPLQRQRCRAVKITSLVTERASLLLLFAKKHRGGFRVAFKSNRLFIKIKNRSKSREIKSMILTALAIAILR